MFSYQTKKQSSLLGYSPTEGELAQSELNAHGQSASSLASFQNIFQAGDDYFLPLQAHIPHSCSQPQIERGKYLGKERLETILSLDQGPHPRSVSVLCEYLIHPRVICLTLSGAVGHGETQHFHKLLGEPASDHGALGRRAACKSSMVSVSLEATETWAHETESEENNEGSDLRVWCSVPDSG